MKPTRNRVFCHDCGRPKMLFDTEQRALNFIRFNSQEIAQKSGRVPTRVYFCDTCNGWHTTSQETYEYRGPSRAERAIHAMAVEKGQGYLRWIEKHLQEAERMLASRFFGTARHECSEILDYCQMHADSLRLLPESAPLMERLSRCVEQSAVNRWHTSEADYCKLVEKNLQQGESLADEGKLQEAYRHLVNAKGNLTCYRKTGVEEGKLHTLSQRISQLEALCHEAREEERRNSQRTNLASLQKKADEFFEKREYAKALVRYENVIKGCEKMREEGFETVIGEQVASRLNECKLKTGLDNLRSKLQNIESLFRQGELAQGKYLLHKAVVLMMELSEIPGEENEKLVLLTRMQDIQQGLVQQLALAG